MRHPFDLEFSDLESVQFNVFEELTDEEAANVAGGGILFTTLAIGEEGGDSSASLAFSQDGGNISTNVELRQKFTTLALGEEGGDEPL